MWDSSGFNECTKQRFASSPRRIGEAAVTLPENLRQVAFDVATFSLQVLSGASFELRCIGFLRGQVPGRQTVSRAELWGAIQVLSRVDEKTNIRCEVCDERYHTRERWNKRQIETCGRSFSS